MLNSLTTLCFNDFFHPLSHFLIKAVHRYVHFMLIILKNFNDLDGNEKVINHLNDEYPDGVTVRGNLAIQPFV